MKKYLFLVTLILAVAATCAADTTIYVTGNCAVTVANAPTPIPVATATPAPVITATPAPVVTATPTLTPSASSTLTPAQGYAQVLSIMVARFPKYDDTGALLPSQYYSFGTVMAPVQNALRAGQTPAKIAAALGTIWSRYATLLVPAGAGGPGGLTYALAWGQATGEAGYSQAMAVLFPATVPVTKPTVRPTPVPVSPGPGVG